MEKNYIKANLNRKKKKSALYVGGAVVIALLSFAVTVSVYKGDTEIEKNIVKNDLASRENIPIIVTADSSTRTIDEPKEEAPVVEEEKKKSTPVKVVPTVAKPVKKEITFIKPVEGEIITEFAKDKLVYSKTLEEWITHNGVDIKAEEATPVKVVADGKIKDKKFDPRYGNTIIVEHENGYISRYSNLSTIDLVNIKQEVKQGDIISGVGAGYGFESEEGPHIHLEILKEGAYISPLDIMSR